MTKLPKRYYQLCFTVVMGTMMVTVMTFVITAVNVGFGPDFLLRWGKAFSVAYFVALPLIYFFAPLARKLAGRVVELP